MALTKEDVVTLAEESLEPYQPTDYRIQVVPHAVEQQDGTWYVVVEPSREDVRSHDFGSRVAEAAADLMERDDVDIQLTTVMPQHAG
jgi:hypothetical protein